MARKKQKLPVPLSDTIDWWRWPQRKKTVQFDNGEYAGGVDHEDDPAWGVLFLSEEQRAMLAGALYRISRRWPMDAPFIKMKEAQYLYDGAYQLMALKLLPIWDLRQLGILIQRQNLPGGDWTTLYDPTPYVIVKSPATADQNIIAAAFGRRGLGINQAGGADALAVLTNGSTGRAAYLSTDNTGNTDPTLTLNRFGANGALLAAASAGSLARAVVNRYAHIVSTLYETGELPPADEHTVGAIVMLEGSTDPVFPNGLYVGTRDDVGGFYWTALVFKGAQSFGLFLNEWYQGISLEETPPGSDQYSLKYPKKQFIDLGNVNINNVAAGEPFAARWVDPPILDPEDPDYLDLNQYQRLEIDVPASDTPPPAEDVIDWIRGDVSLPDPGTSKVYRITVLADSGVIFPFIVPDGYVIETISPLGLWEVTDPLSGPPQESLVISADGDLTSAEPYTGRLMVGFQDAGSVGEWAYIPYDVYPIEVDGDAYMKFAQHRQSSPTAYGAGYLAVEVVLAAPEPPQQYNATAQPQHNCQVISCTHLGGGRWRVVAVQQTVTQDSYGSVSIACVENIPFTPGRCWSASEVDFALWSPAPLHNAYLECGGLTYDADIHDVGVIFMEFPGSIGETFERFDYRFTGTTAILEFDLTGYPS